jgi:hypothetical protein
MSFHDQYGDLDSASDDKVCVSESQEADVTKVWDSQLP